MFDIGFIELVVVGIIALLVLGPERLPKAARTAGKWVGRARRMVSQFTSELDRQIELEELREKLKQQGGSLDIEKDVQQIHRTVQDALNEVDEYEPLPRKDPDQPFRPEDYVRPEPKVSSDQPGTASHSSPASDEKR